MANFDWSGFLGIAEELVQRAGDEAAERTAIGRSYYAAYCMARQYLDADGSQIPKSGRGHNIVWSTLHNVPRRAHRRIADRGRRLRQFRTRADYEASYENVSKEARTAVALARQILDDLAELPQSK